MCFEIDLSLGYGRLSAGFRKMWDDCVNCISCGGGIGTSAYRRGLAFIKEKFLSRSPLRLQFGHFESPEGRRRNVQTPAGVTSNAPPAVINNLPRRAFSW
jgi:hypothetical protein